LEGDSVSLRLCIAQISSVWEDPVGSLEKVRPLIAEAACQEASVICFPEQFATGWDPMSIRHVQPPDGQITTTLRRYACDFGISILGSFREEDVPCPKNTSMLIGTDGKVHAKYSKCHLFSPAGEQLCYRPGDRIDLFTLAGMRCGIAICYDLRFPPLFRAYARAGAEVVFVPAAWPASRIAQWELLIRSRALEHQMYIVGINTTGMTPVDSYNGHSIISGPDGEVITRAGEEEELLYAVIDSARVEESRGSFPVEKDRRTDLYHRLLKKTDF